MCIAGMIITGFPSQVCLAAREGAADAVKKSDFVLKPEVSYKAADVKDPFKSWLPEPPIPVPSREERDVEVKLPDFTIAGIFWGADFPQAIINDTIVKVGDTILEAKIIGIEPEGVTVNFNRRDFLLKAPAVLNTGTINGIKEAPNEKSRKKR